MFFALDNNGNKIHIRNALAKNNYFCPACGEKLILKRGEIRIHHFAHSTISSCTDKWHYDMSEWHRRWQARFPQENQEIVKEKDGKRHRADVLFEDKKVIFEFQHSPLSREEFNDRNVFYKSLGYKIIWVFDVTDEYENEDIINYKNDLYSWFQPKRTFDNFNPKVDGIELFFQIKNSAKDNEEMVSLQRKIDAGYSLHFNEDYYDSHKDDTNVLIKITWAPENGFGRFASDGLIYDENDIVNRLDGNPKGKKKTIRIGDLYDRLAEVNRKDHTIYYFGCPISSTGMSGSSSIDIPESKHNEIMPCNWCKHSATDDQLNPICKKRFNDLGISKSTQVEVLEQTSAGFVVKIAYDDKGRKIIDLPTITSPMLGSIYSLWDQNNYKIAIFKNLNTQKRVKIGKNPSIQKQKYNKVNGYISRDQYSFYEDSREIFGCEKPEWICVWSVK